jgi:hypothetical protein
MIMEQSSLETTHPSLYDIYSEEFNKWYTKHDPSSYFIEGGRTIPYDFHYFCSAIWGLIQHQRGTTFEMFREQMLNTATSYQGDLKDALWETIKNFNNSI